MPRKPRNTAELAKDHPDPEPTKKRPGRPSFVPSVAMRREVEKMMGAGFKQFQIARSLGIDEDTLRKHFRHELDLGISKTKRAALALAWKYAKLGNPTLIKKLIEMGEAASGAEDFNLISEGKVSAELPSLRPVRRGKKEIAHDAALNAGADSPWGDDLAPLPGVRPTVN